MFDRNTVRSCKREIRRKIGRGIEIHTSLREGTRRGRNFSRGWALWSAINTTRPALSSIFRMIIGWTLSRHPADFPLGRPSSQTETVHLFHHPSMYTRRLYTILLHIVACTCQHSPVTLLHRSDFPNASTVRDHRLQIEAFWKIACSEFGLCDRFRLRFSSVQGW